MADRSIRRRRAVAVIIAVPLVLGAALWALTYSPIFRARHIRVEGNTYLSAAQVTNLAGVTDATNVFHAPAGEIEAALTASPWIGGASVAKRLPSTLVLRITELRPVGVVTGMGDTAVLASDGSLLPTPKGSLQDLPVVRAALSAPTQDQRAAAAALLVALPPVVGKQVTDVLVEQDAAVSLTLRSGVRVRAGRPGNEPAKAEALRAVLRWAILGRFDVSTIDVASPLAPSTTLSDGSTFTP